MWLSFTNVENSSSCYTPIIVKIGKFEDLLIDGQAILVDEAGDLSKKVECPGDYDSEDEVALVDNDMTRSLASERVSFGTQSLLEQWRDSYGNGDYDEDPYDDTYEGHDLPQEIQAICDNLVYTDLLKKTIINRDTLENYLLELQRLGRTLLGLIGQAVNIDKEEMVEIFEDGMQSVRMTYYPSCPQPDLVVGLTPHSDAAGITILLQVNNVEGLQVKKDGVWIPVNFLPDAFVVNVGDILEIMSNGVYNSIEHRAVVNATKERISVAMFFNPKLEADVGPSKSLIKSTRNPPLYKTLIMEQYLKEFFSRKLNGKTFLEKMKIKQDEDDKT
ncbi:codeine O-demethylase-like protein [Tanacetum coccineum]